MKLRNWIALGLVATTPFLTMACGGKDDAKGGDGDGGSGNGNSGDGDGTSSGTSTGDVDLSSLEKEIDSLKDIIDDLEDQLKNASQQEIPDLQDELDAALDRLNELETCMNGGSCDGVEEAHSFKALTDAYCDWVFGCCSDVEVSATIGNAAQDKDSCKDMFGQLLLRGGSYASIPAFSGMVSDSYDLGQLAARLQSGRVSLNEDAVEECADAMAAQKCADYEGASEYECGMAEANPCGELLTGLQKEGESCAHMNECENGLFCSGYDEGYADGVCLSGAEEDDLCQEEEDCNNAEGDLYCDESSGSCKVRPGEGDDCDFEDPTFSKLSPEMMAVPCMPGYMCSPESHTCIAACDTLDKGDTCTDSDQCGADGYCDFSKLDDQMYAGECAEKLNAGAASTDPEACLSGAVFSDTDASSYDAVDCKLYSTNYTQYQYYADQGDDEAAAKYLSLANDYVEACAFTCAGQGGESCSYDDFSGADCSSGSCTEGDKCRSQCDGDWDCGDDDSCVDGICYEAVSANSECLVTEQCPDAQWCNPASEKCENRVEEGDPDDSSDNCTTNNGPEKCASGSACVLSECRPYKGLGSGETCTDWYHCTSGRCDRKKAECLGTSGLKDKGDDCSLDGVAEANMTNINYDPCKKGLFCKLDGPGSTDGVCTEQREPGTTCDRSLDPAVKQCVGNETCSMNPNTGAYACRVPYSEPDEQNKCVLGSRIFGVSVAYGNFGPAKIKIEEKELEPKKEAAK